MTEDFELEPGTALGPYVIERKIGRGGMGDVYLAYRPVARGVGRRVALKVLLREIAADLDAQNSFVDEACLAALINDVHTVGVFDYGTEPLTYIAMEYVNGPSLAALTEDLAQRNMTWPPEMTIKIAGDVLNGLSAAHELEADDGTNLGVVHRDVSPENVLVGLDGVARVTDFGIARAADRLAHTQFGVLKGRGGYMAPEQLTEASYDHRADLFSMGIILWELFAGRRLLEVGLGARLSLPLIAVPKIPSLPASLGAVLEKAVTGDPDRRYQSARAFSDDLERAARQHGWVATSADLARFINGVRNGERWSKSDTRATSTRVTTPHRTTALLAAVVAGTVASGIAPTAPVSVQAATTTRPLVRLVEAPVAPVVPCPVAPPVLCKCMTTPLPVPNPVPRPDAPPPTPREPETQLKQAAKCERAPSDGSIRNPWPDIDASCPAPSN